MSHINNYFKANNSVFFHHRIIQMKTDEDHKKRLDTVNKENEVNGRLKVFIIERSYETLLLRKLLFLLSYNLFCVDPLI